MGDWGIKVSLPGKSVYSTNPQDFVFHSKYGSVKIAQEPPNKGVLTATVNGNSTLTVTIAHNLGFIPLAMVFAERKPGTGRYYFGSTYIAPEESNDFVEILGGSSNTYLDSTNLVIKFNNRSGSQQTVNYYYFIFGDAGS